MTIHIWVDLDSQRVQGKASTRKRLNSPQSLVGSKSIPGQAPKVPIWEFPEIGDLYFWVPNNGDPTIQGTILGSPIFGNSHLTCGNTKHAMLHSIP